MSDTQPEGTGVSEPKQPLSDGVGTEVDAHGGTERPPPAEPAPEPSLVRGGAAAETQESEPVARVGQVLAGRYRIEKELGAGGMGAVYRAEHVHMRKAVAVKVLHREMTYLPEVVARFEREAVAAARIEHPHVAAATDFGRLDDGAFYLVLEYVEGQSLRDLIDGSGALSPALAVHVTRQIADALAAAHAAGIVHRDLKPDNVMLISRDGDEHFAKVLDFGIAKVETGDNQNQLTQLGSVFGTPEYMAPEQAAGTPVDARADLYTLGIILYEMLTGATPFAGDDLVVVLTRQMTTEPAPLPAAIDPAVAELTMQLLCKDPEQRPQTAADVVARLEAIEASGLLQEFGAPLTPSPTSVTVAGGAVSGSQGVAHAATVLSLPGRELAHSAAGGQRASGPISQLLGPIWQKFPALRRPVDLGGPKVPLGALVALGAGVAIVGALVLLVLVASGVSATKGVAASGSSRTNAARAPDEDTQALARRAATGDRAAIAKLQERPETERTAFEWRALGRGLAAIGHTAPSLRAYEKALGLDPTLAKDKDVIVDVRRAALGTATAKDALALALSSLGTVGPDLIYDVWSNTRSSKDKQEVARAARELLDGSAIRSRASPALLVALDLGKARGCPSVKELLPRVEQHADTRSTPKLKTLAGRSGCGFLGLSDCYSCLRSGGLLERAAKAAEARPAPKF